MPWSCKPIMNPVNQDLFSLIHNRFSSLRYRWFVLMSDAGNANAGAEKTMMTSFVSSGRTGRRNAMGDILTEGQVCADTSALPQELGTLNISGSQDNQSRTQKNPEGASSSNWRFHVLANLGNIASIFSVCFRPQVHFPACLVAPWISYRIGLPVTLWRPNPVYSMTLRKSSWQSWRCRCVSV